MNLLNAVLGTVILYNLVLVGVLLLTHLKEL